MEKWTSWVYVNGLLNLDLNKTKRTVHTGYAPLIAYRGDILQSFITFADEQYEGYASVNLWLDSTQLNKHFLKIEAIGKWKVYEGNNHVGYFYPKKLAPEKNLDYGQIGQLWKKSQQFLTIKEDNYDFSATINFKTHWKKGLSEYIRLSVYTSSYAQHMALIDFPRGQIINYGEECIAKIHFLEIPNLYENLIEGFCFYAYGIVPDFWNYKTIQKFPPSYLFAEMTVIDQENLTTSNDSSFNEKNN